MKTIYVKSRNLALFYVWEDARVFCFDIHVSYPESASCDFYILRFLGTHPREWLQHDGC